MLRMSSRRQGRLVRDKALKLFENMKSFKRKHLQDGGNVCIAAVHVGRGAERPKQALCSLRLALNSESLQCMWTTISRFYQIEMPQRHRHNCIRKIFFFAINVTICIGIRAN